VENKMDRIILERVFIRLLEESYRYGWPEYEEEWFDKEGMTTWEEDREWTKQYFKSIGLIR
tara:strand:+ start:230 stop:412 length:183 start_codon:yes stop_codon:yes gene_type:complete